MQLEVTNGKKSKALVLYSSINNQHLPEIKPIAAAHWFDGFDLKT
jgi:hypothetical protein